MVNSRGNDPDLYLDACVFSINTKLSASTRFSPFYLNHMREACYVFKVPRDYTVCVFNYIIIDMCACACMCVRECMCSEILHIFSGNNWVKIYSTIDFYLH